MHYSAYYSPYSGWRRCPFEASRAKRRATVGYRSQRGRGSPMLQHKADIDPRPGLMIGLLEELHHPFMIGQGIAAPVFLDVSGAGPRRWCLVGEDELGVVRR